MVVPPSEYEQILINTFSYSAISTDDELDKEIYTKPDTEQTEKDFSVMSTIRQLLNVEFAVILYCDVTLWLVCTYLTCFKAKSNLIVE